MLAYSASLSQGLNQNTNRNRKIMWEKNAEEPLEASAADI